LEILKPKLQDLKLDDRPGECRSTLRSCNFGFKISNSSCFQIAPSRIQFQGLVRFQDSLQVALSEGDYMLQILTFCEKPPEGEGR